MQAATKTLLLNASAAAQTAIEALGTACTAYTAACKTASDQANANELAIITAVYSDVKFYEACLQAMGAVNLVNLVGGTPQVIAATGKRIGGNVSTIMSARLVGF